MSLLILTIVVLPVLLTCMVYVSTPELVTHCIVIPSLCNADHNGVEIDCSWKSTARHNCANNSADRTVWSYKLADWDKANSLIDDFDWDVLLLGDINKSWSNWCEKFLSIMDCCIPRRRLPPRKNVPWLTKELINLMRKKNLLYKCSKRLHDFSKYKNIRNTVTSELHKAKMSFFQGINPHNPKEFRNIYLTYLSSPIYFATPDDCFADL